MTDSTVVRMLRLLVNVEKVIILRQKLPEANGKNTCDFKCSDVNFSQLHDHGFFLTINTH